MDRDNVLNAEEASMTKKSDEPTYRLPKTVAPTRYALEISPDLEQGTFSGEETATLEVREPVSEMVINGDGLEVFDVRLRCANGQTLTGSVTVMAEEEQVRLGFPETVPAGPATLSLRYRGKLTEDLRGFYRTVVTGADGSRMVIASTQCEATDARRVFPGWDEPEFKAVFAITLVVDEGLKAYSNGREISSAPTGDGKRRVTFSETMPMSSYLIALAVGPFEATEPLMVGDTPVRVIARPGQAHLTDTAREDAAAHLRFFEEYFGIPYPGDKIDHIAIPDFAAGAMENLGLVTYRDEALLMDPERAAPMDRFWISEVIAHETAHMWFGDLVTMRWWNGIWLNEAFATFMGTTATDALHPEFDAWTVFGRGRSYALMVDGLEATRPIEYHVGRPAEAWGMFDALTYQKGGAILRMLEQYLGATVFRDGIRHYLDIHRYGNTETGDLWDALEEVSGEPVRAMMDGWVFQGGHPVIRAERTGPGRITLSAHPFRYQGEGTGSWSTPVIVGAHRQGGETVLVPVIVGTEPVLVDIPEDISFVVINAGGHGFYRTAYDPELFAAVAAHLDELSGLERMGLVEDVWAAVLTGLAPLAQAVELWRHLPRETDPDIVEAVASQIALLDNVADESGREALQAFVRAIAQPALESLGWDEGPGEDIRRGRTRAALVRLVGINGEDPVVQARARELLLGHLDDGRAVPAELLSAAAGIVAHKGEEGDWDRLFAAFTKAQTPQEETRYLYALGAVTKPDLIARTLDLYESDRVKIQDGAMALGRMLRNRHARRAGWDRVERDWEEIEARYPHQMLGGIYGAIGSAVEDDLARRTVAFVDAHPITELLRQTEQAKEFQRIYRAFMGRVGHEVAGILRS